ncbi:MAG TPA: helix-turn-helix transcriptional regulator [Gemmataceae bacterium]|jgi:transcriptional regulator with XRE-family HTH domain|nr:helix-turn-helix transcriptional regulator [Gemmataceae bacterium]
MSAAKETDESGNHPTYDEVYTRVIKEQFDKSALDDDFVKEVVKRFRQAPVTLCSRAIGMWINQKLRQLRWTQQELADKLSVDRSAVAYWIQGGNIHLANLAQVLIEFKCQWSELPVPARQELATAAYLAALSYIQGKLRPGQSSKALDRERFWCLFHLFGEQHWERAIRRKDPVLLRDEADRILKGVAAAIGEKPRSIVNVEGLKQLVSEWGLAWMVCLSQVPRKWAIQ